MAKKKRPRKLSIGELRLMSILWERGPMTLAEVYEAKSSQGAYTTIQTQLNRLVDKGVVVRTKLRPMKYRAVIDSRDAANDLLQILILSIGGGSVVPLLEHIISQVELSKEDVRSLKTRLDKAGPKPSRAAKTSKAIKKVAKRKKS